MKKLTIITGGRASGKTTEAKRIIGNDKYVELNRYDLNSIWKFREVTEETKHILVEESNLDTLKIFQEIIFKGFIEIHCPMRKPKIIRVPNIILVFQSE